MTDKERDPEATGPEGAAEPEATADAAAPDAAATANAADPEPQSEAPSDDDLTEAQEPLASVDDLPVDEVAPVAAVAPAGLGKRRDKAAQAKGQPAAAPSVAQEAVHVQDRASAWFVIIVVGVFVAILAYGLLFGHRGFFSGILATPSPVPTVPASVEPTVAPSQSAAPSVSVAPSGSVAPSSSVTPSVAPSVAPSASTAPSVGPSAAPASASPAAS